MLAIQSPSTNPYWNLAAEEHLLKDFKDEIFFSYQNVPTVVVGKHQNALAEVDIHFLAEQEILLARRLSGGGAVYHDLGNVNFSFIKSPKGNNLVDFEGYTRPVVNFLQSLGVPAHFGGHNSIMVGTKKISGNAEHVSRGRVLHHGTLLFASNLNVLAQCLYTARERFTDKAVRSVRADVVNLSNLIKHPMDIEEFRNELFQFITNHFGAKLFQIDHSDRIKIDQLVSEKYSTQEWILGYSPPYSKMVELHSKGKQLVFTITITNGVISGFESQHEHPLLKFLGSTLPGTLHEPNAIRAALEHNTLDTNTINPVLEALF